MSGVAVERGAGALLAEIARDRGGQFLDRHRGTPQPEARRDRRKVGRHEQVGLQPFDRSRLASERKRHIGEHVERRLQTTPCASGGRSRPSSACGRSHAMPHGPCVSTLCPTMPASAKLGSKQRIGPGQDADRHAGHRAARGRAPPDQPAEEGRRKLRDRRKGQKPDRGELRVARQPVIHVGEEQDDEDRHAPHRQQGAADVVAAGDQGFATLEHQRHHDVVRHHDGERDRSRRSPWRSPPKGRR